MSPLLSRGCRRPSSARPPTLAVWRRCVSSWRRCGLTDTVSPDERLASVLDWVVPLSRPQARSSSSTSPGPRPRPWPDSPRSRQPPAASARGDDARGGRRPHHCPAAGHRRAEHRHRQWAGRPLGSARVDPQRPFHRRQAVPCLMFPRGSVHRTVRRPPTTPGLAATTVLEHHARRLLGLGRQAPCPRFRVRPPSMV